MTDAFGGPVSQRLEATLRRTVQDKSLIVWLDPHEHFSGFATLTGEQSHKVLRPITLALTRTVPEAIAPALEALKRPFLVSLRAAEEEAHIQLDAILSEGDTKLIVTCDLATALRNREVTSLEDVELILEEIRTRLTELVAKKKRIRLL